MFHITGGILSTCQFVARHFIVMVCAIVCSGLEDMPYFVVRKKGGTLPMVSDRSLVQTT